MKQAFRLLYKKGFTLVEMLVAVAIFTMMSAIILYNYPEFNNASALDNLAHQIALSIREAQVYGISVRQTQSGYAGYGIFVDRSAPNSFILFTDKDNSKTYDEAAGEMVSQFTINAGNFIQDLCYNLQSSTYSVNSSKIATCGSQTLTIVFTRPDPDAFISVIDRNGIAVPAYGSATSPNVSGEIVLSSNRGTYRKIIQVYTTGQITVRSS